jgi:hypothetical protein
MGTVPFSAPTVRDYLRSRGGILAMAAVIAQLAAAHFVFYNQPENVRTALAGSVLYRSAGFAWFGAAGLILAFGAWTGFIRPAAGKGASHRLCEAPEGPFRQTVAGTFSGGITGWLAAAAGFLAVTTMTLFRDGLRDLTLLGEGYDVWQRTVVTNWSVVVLFLLLFVAGLAIVGWLITVMLRARPVSEEVAP